MTQEVEARESQRPSKHASLDPFSYTAERLAHANPEHLYITTRRCFIGPIPEGWLKSHRRDWYKHHLHLNYSSRISSFNADSNVSRQRRLSGLEGPSASATYYQSFRQPADLEDDSEENGEQEANVTGSVEVPRSSNLNDDVPQVDRQHDGQVDGQDDIQEWSRPLDGDTPKMSSQSSFSQLDGAEQSRESLGDEQEMGQLRGKSLDRSESGLQIPSRENRAEASNATGSSRITSVTEGTGISTVDHGAAAESMKSTKSLLDHKDPAPAENVTEEELPRRESVTGVLSKLVKPSHSFTNLAEGDTPLEVDLERRRSHFVSFAVPEDSRRAELLHKARATQMQLQRSASELLKGKPKEGRIIKMEKMLVRVDLSAEKQLPDDYDENGSQGVITRVSEKWREFMVVCRESTDQESDFVLQMYKTRVIPAIQDSRAKIRTKFEIPLNKRASQVNMFSSLDKTIVVWVPYSRGTTIYLLRARSSSNAVEWYTFLRNILGWRRAQELQIVVPDLDVTLRLKNPFKELEQSQDLSEDGDVDENALKKKMDQEQAVASIILHRSLNMLEKDPDWAEVVRRWATIDRVGLAWKRYDRLEWIHGANERKMYGTIAMQKSHELELRPKTHSPTSTRTRKGKALTEPAPVEGFLVRLTSQRGAHQRLGRLFYKRLYFCTQDHYLFFSRPAKSSPPPPPRLPVSEGSSIPNARQIAEKIPLVYAVNPYPVEDGEIAWLAHSQHRASVKDHDEDAHDEAERNLNIVLECDGFIDLRNIKKVRNIKRGATPADENLEEGSDVDFDEDVPDTMTDDGSTEDVQDERTFELVLSNGLVMRLQAYDKTTKKEWKKRLQELIRYWRHRCIEEMDFYKSVRKENFEELGIDDLDAEATIGQFGKKWEVTQTYASPELYNMCGISCCRTIHMSGQLYRKPRLHSTFTLMSVVLVPGHLLIFSPTLRTRTGKDIPIIHHERQRSLDLDLSKCYLYSGLLTENDLLYTNKTFDSNRPGRHGLHRWYADDSWKVADEDVMCTFVLWYQRRKEWLRVPGSSAVKALAARTGEDTEAEASAAHESRRNRQRRDSEAAEKEGGGSTRARFRRVSQLGVKGRGIVFKARSRAERDRWVLAIMTEIDRVAGAEDVRLTGTQNKKNGEE